jgi:hypothetical protein
MGRSAMFAGIFQRAAIVAADYRQKMPKSPKANDR